MKDIADQLRSIINIYSPRLTSIPGSEFEIKPLPNKWSKKEILGHLVDSAQNNARRFVVAQYENSPLIEYDQDKWVSISHYQSYHSSDLIQVWILLNRHICRILEHMPPETVTRTCKTGHAEEHTLEWIAKDYVRHLMHHLNQILPPANSY
ncbi:MAG: hypothetical protein C5B59_11450 [Bacteroidetes bacterium]|nr:MAG: hypothetical protein C5B59_11450 [Bacteroidota bacterium]